ncbi:hypothetical protein RUND412_003560 [Rhizina undulata]
MHSTCARIRQRNIAYIFGRPGSTGQDSVLRVLKRIAFESLPVPLDMHTKRIGRARSAGNADFNETGDIL